MQGITLKKIAQWTDGKNIGPEEVELKNAVIDSREVQENSLFFCIKGKKNDGHDFIDDVHKKGGYAVGENRKCDIQVSSTLKALADTAREYRKIISPNIIAITGSNGKTTTTRIAGKIMQRYYQAVSTPKSFNNQIGLPITILQMEKDTQYGIFEMGANHCGEIKFLCDILKPDIGVITNVGEAHIGYFKTRENILNTKFELADSLPFNGILVYNFDQKKVRKKAENYKVKRFGFGFNHKAEFRGEIIKQGPDYSRFLVNKEEYVVNLPGRFNIYNSLAAIAICKIIGLDSKKIAKVIEKIRPLPHRTERTKVKGIEILDDTYNSNPASVKKLFDELLKNYPQKDIIAVMGDMRELGSYSKDLHREVGEYIATKNNVKYILAGGKFGQEIINGAKKAGVPARRLIVFKNLFEAARKIKKYTGNNSLVVLKASRAEKFNEIIEMLKR
ncbi:MAG: UDP-N-acetylmuramoyl-tripeptide--D-alanyl-D-alanine ligase [Elusimicrobiota bacterium]